MVAPLLSGCLRIAIPNRSIQHQISLSIVTAHYAIQKKFEGNPHVKATILKSGSHQVRGVDFPCNHCN